MDLNEFAKEVHANAVAHGWWETERDPAEIIALIHSEWSEALEEYRAGRPMVWHECMDEGQAPEDRPVVCEQCTDCYYYGKECEHRGKKPEGIAVELIDGCIRILDFAAHEKVSLEFGSIEPLQPTPPKLIADLHYYTSYALNDVGKYGKIVEHYFIPKWLGVAVYEALRFIHVQGIDPEKIMLEKHEYNRTRPYRHGGKKC
nr:MAG TPA: NTP-PPase-like protein [Caudoviricetes sp.]